MGKLLIIVPVVVLVLMFGCPSLIEGEQQKAENLPYPEKTVDQLLSEYGVGKDFEFGQMEETDNGIAYVIGGEKLTESITLEKRVEYEAQPDGRYRGSITLTFRDSAPSTVYTYVAYIPKEFADDISKVRFSIEPTRIINRDIETEHRFNFSKQMDLVVTAIENEDEQDVADKIVRLAAEFNAEKCFSMEDMKDKLPCMLKVINGFPERSRKFCENLANNPKTALSSKVCFAVLEEKPGYCEDMIGIDSTMNWNDVLICKGTVFSVMKEVCDEYGTQAKKDDCLLAAALKTDELKEACSGISDRDKYNLCLAYLEKKPATQRAFCGQIDSDELRKQCCDKVAVGEEDKTECFGGSSTQPPPVNEVIESDCGFEGAKCCECYECSTGLTCDTSTYNEKCVKCGAQGQQPCDKCGGFNPLGTTCCVQKPEVEACSTGLAACSDEQGGPLVCRSCGCYDQSCCNGKCNSGMTCHMNICATWHDLDIYGMCEGDSDCAKVRRCVDGYCMLRCATDSDCSRSGSNVCKGGVCRQK